MANVSELATGVYSVELYHQDIKHPVWAGKVEGVKTSSCAATRAINAYTRGIKG